MRSNRLKSKRCIAVALAILCLVLCLLLFWSVTSDVSSESREPVGPVAERSTSASARAREVKDPDLEAVRAERRPAARKSEPAVDLVTEDDELAKPEPWNVLALELTAVDERGCPVGGACVSLAPLDHPSNVAGWTDSAGRFAVRWPCKRPRMRVALRVATEHGEDSGLRAVEVASETSRLVLPLYAGSPSDPTMRAALGDSDATRARLAALGYADGSPGGKTAGESAEKRVASAMVFDHGLGVFALRTSAPDEMPSSSSVKLPRDWTIAAKSEPAPRLATGSITGNVHAPDGSIAQGVCVRAWNDRAAFGDVAESDAEGRFHFEHVPAAEIRLQALGSALGRAETTLALAKGSTAHWEAVLAHDTPFTGRITGERGEPLAAWNVELSWTSGGERSVAIAKSIADGTFAIDGAPSGPLAMDVCAPMQSARIASRVERGLVPTNRPFIVDRVVLPRGAIEARFTSERGITARDVEAIAWELESGRGVTLERAGRDRSHRAANLPPGRYCVSAGRKGSAWLQSKTVTLAAGERVDLGTLLFRAPGRVNVELASGALSKGMPLEAVLFARGSDTDSLVAAFDVAAPFERELAPGDYWIATRDGDGWRRVDFEIGSEATTRVELPGSARAPRLGWEQAISDRSPPRR